MAADGSPGAGLAGMVDETRGEPQGAPGSSSGPTVTAAASSSSPVSESPPTRPDPAGPETVAESGAAAVGNRGARRFLCGVVEGFYGRPWVMEQRKELFRRLQKWGLNTYLYAPKDDYKHRMFWREMYSVEEAEQLMTLIAAAQEYEIEFIYAISPGLDITFSNPKEVSTLKRKLDQNRLQTSEETSSSPPGWKSWRQSGLRRIKVVLTSNLMQP